MATTLEHCSKLLDAKLQVLEAQERLAKETRRFLEDAVMDGHFELLSINMNAVYMHADQELAWKLRDMLPRRCKPLIADKDKDYTQEYVDGANVRRSMVKKY